MNGPVDRAWEAIDAGRPEEALQHLGELSTASAQVPRALALTELGLLDEAEEVAQHFPRDADDEDALWTIGQLRLRQWRIEEARATFEELRRGGESPGLLERLALCADLRGDLVEADRLLARAHALDPEGFPPVPRLKAEEFEAETRAALALLPEEFREALAEMEVVVEPVPPLDWAGRGDAAATPPDLLGLFDGTSLIDRCVESGAEVPPRVFLFQRNLERAARDRSELRREIRVTLYHEIGHALGFDEAGVDEMGLG